MTFLICPACGNECEAIPSCGESHRDCAADWHAIDGDWWCEDRYGMCECCAVLTVEVDEGVATLVEVDP